MTGMYDRGFEMAAENLPEPPKPMPIEAYRDSWREFFDANCVERTRKLVKA